MITSWNELPLGKYEALRKAADITDETDRAVAVLAILNDMTEDQVGDLPIVTFTKLNAQAAFVYRDIPVDKARVMRRYKVGGWDLIPCTEVEAMTTVQYIDYQTLAQRGNDALPQLLSCLLVPKGHTYGNGYDVAAVQQALRESLTVTEARDLVAFFLSASIGSIADTLNYSTLRKVPELKWMTRRQHRRAMRLLRASVRSGAGSIASMLFPNPLGEPGMPSGSSTS